MKMKEVQQVTTCIKHLAVSGLSSVSARIISSYNLIGNRFEMPNVSYTQPLVASVGRQCYYRADIGTIKFLTSKPTFGTTLTQQTILL